MENAVASAGGAHNSVRIADIPNNEVRLALKVADTAGGKIVQHAHLVTHRREMTHEVRPNEPCTASHKVFLHLAAVLCRPWQSKRSEHSRMTKTTRSGRLSVTIPEHM